MKVVRFASVVCVSLSVLFSSCSSYQQQAEVVGEIEGAGLGVPPGNADRDGVGTASARAEVQGNGQQDTRQYERYGITPDQPQAPPERQGIHDPRGTLATAPAPTRSTKEYPVARRTSKPDEVESPYPPNHRINIGGFRSGQLAKDPKNGKIFRVP